MINDMKSLENKICELEETIKKRDQSNFSCVECKNEHQQILDWLIELKSYKTNQTPINNENPNMLGYMTLDEAISHTKEIIKQNSDKEIKESHIELLGWLEELKNYRKR